jgi:hypothetical protein
MLLLHDAKRLFEPADFSLRDLHIIITDLSTFSKVASLKRLWHGR